MAVVALKSDAVTKLETAPNPLMQASRNSGGYIESMVAYASKAAGDSATSTYRMLRVHSSWRIAHLWAMFTALGTGGLADIGLYQTIANGGAVVDVDAFDDALDVAARVEVIDVNLRNGVPADATKQLWERISGLTEDPNRFYDIVITLEHAGAGDAATMMLAVEYQR